MVSCSYCKGLLIRHAISSYAKICSEGKSYPINLTAHTMGSGVEEDFRKTILDGLRRDTAGNVVINDRLLSQEGIGYVR